MDAKPIKTEIDYQDALAEVEALWEAEDGTPEADRLELLVLLIENYERHHHRIDAPNPIDFLRYVMEVRRLTRKDLEPFIGTRARVAEVLNRVRPLLLTMIRQLAAGLDISPTVLIQPYELRKQAA